MDRPFNSNSPPQGGLCCLYALLALRSSSSSAVMGSFWPLCIALSLVFFSAMLIAWASPGGPAWSSLKGKNTIPGPRGWPLLGILTQMGSQAHRRLAALAYKHQASHLMAFSLGSTRVIITSKPDVAKELLSSSSFADRPLKQSAQQLLFGRAIGFAPYGEYWRKLRRIAATNLFAPKRIAAHEHFRQKETISMLEAIAMESRTVPGGAIHIRPFLQHAALNNIMVSVFGKSYDFKSKCGEAEELQSMVREGFELLGAFNMADHLPFLRNIDPSRIHERCQMLVPRVNTFVQKIIDEHRSARGPGDDASDFVHVLLALQGEEKLEDMDLIAILWEMIFRGTDTMAILTEWIMAELVINQDIQAKVQAEIETCVGALANVRDADVARMPYLQAVVKEGLRLHPPGPLLSWARLATEDVELAGHMIPAGTTAMVNMWAITHDAAIWEDPDRFWPERFTVAGGDVDVRGGDMRLAPFGGGRRVCPGRALGMATVHVWVARLLHHFTWKPNPHQAVDMTEVLKLSCEMAIPLSSCPIPRYPIE